MATRFRRSKTPRRLARALVAAHLIAACAPSTVVVSGSMIRAGEDDFLVGGMRTVTTIALESATCTRLHVPLVGTLRDVDLLLVDDAGQVLAADLREDEAPLVEICTRHAATVHALVRVLSGAGHVRLEVVTAPLRDAPRTSRAGDVVEEAFVDLDEPGSLARLRQHAAELARRGFGQTEAIEEDVMPESGTLEIPSAVAPGACLSFAVVSAGDMDVSLVDAGGRIRVTASHEGDLAALQTCDEGAMRAVLRGAPGTRFHYLVAHGSAREIGGPSGLWLGRPETSASP